jgi:hypothetical protein
MNVEIGTEAALFPEKEYIRGFSLQCTRHMYLKICPEGPHCAVQHSQPSLSSVSCHMHGSQFINSAHGV